MRLRQFISFFLLISWPATTAHKSAPGIFRNPKSDAVDNVNPLIGNGGDTPNGSGGMIPSTAPPFAMTRWVAQTRQNFVSMLPYNETDTSIHGFQATHQPAIWMGESGQVVVVPGTGLVKDVFEERGMSFIHDDEVLTASYYSVELDAQDGGKIFAEQSATSRVGHFRFTFANTSAPYVLLQATRASIIGSADVANTTLPQGTVSINPSAREITGSNPERQDFIIQPLSTPAEKWSGYFCARFDTDFVGYGVANNGTQKDEQREGEGTILSGYVKFGPKTKIVNVRVGVSFISVDQARKNLDAEVPDGTSLEVTAKKTRTEWAEKLDRIQISGATEAETQVFYTAFFHTLQYPYEQDEDGKYFSGYDDAVHEGYSYTGYSIWDTYRAEWAWLILLAPERIPGMVQSMLQDYKEGGWLPMWKNIIETNIMVGTHADSLIAEAVLKGITGFSLDTAWRAVYKDATVPPKNDKTTVYGDREENVDYEVRAGLSSVYAEKGWVADDIHSEAGSRTLDYAYDDHAVSILAGLLNKSSDAAFFHNRAVTNPFTLYNHDTGFMEARNANGSWAGPDSGWTEGDKWAYSFDVVQDIDGLIKARGGQTQFVKSLDEHFDGGHNDHTNEPSHHIPYLYAMSDAAYKSQSRIREIAKENYNATSRGLSGNEDCGQMSAWFLFSALGFYPVDPLSGDYIVGSPFFDRVKIRLPGAKQPLEITSMGAPKKPYVKSLTVNGKDIQTAVITHDQIAQGGKLEFDMSSQPEAWASGTLILQVDSEPMQDRLIHSEL